MGSFMKTVQTNAIVQAVLFIVLGLVLLLVPGITLVSIVYLVGAIFAISGLVSLVAYYRESSPSYKQGGALTWAIFLLVVALVMFIFPTAIAGFFSVVLGAVLIICGAANLIRSASLRGLGGQTWLASAIVGAIVLVGGIVIVWNPFETTVMFVMVLGVLLVVNGVSGLIVELGMRKRLKG